MKNIMTIEEFQKELMLVGYSKEGVEMETKSTFTHGSKLYECKKILAVRLADDWCQGFDLKDGSIWAIAKVQTVPTKFLKSIEETKKHWNEYCDKQNYDDVHRKHLIKDMTEAFYTKEKPYRLHVYGCDDSSHSQAFATMREIDKLFDSWSKNPPDAPWVGSIFTN
jgi:hypothetical protein